MEIATGTPEDHPTPLPLDQGQSPGVVAPTAIAGNAPVQGGVLDLTGQRLSQAAASEAEWSAAMSSAMGAEHGRRDHYAVDILPQGASYGDPVPVEQYPNPAFEVPASQSADYLFAGDEPVPPAG
jgi:hypothetical protein